MATGMTLSRAERGAAWKADSEASPVAGGYRLDSIEEGSPAGREKEGGRLFMSDIVVRMRGVQLLRAGVGVMTNANTFVGHEQTLEIKVWR